jgi:hypothetical protein
MSAQFSQYTFSRVRPLRVYSTIHRLPGLPHRQQGGLSCAICLISQSSSIVSRSFQRIRAGLVVVRFDAAPLPAFIADLPALFDIVQPHMLTLLFLGGELRNLLTRRQFAVVAVAETALGAGVRPGAVTREIFVAQVVFAVIAVSSVVHDYILPFMLQLFR